MPVNLHSKKRLVARMYKVGMKRISFDSDHLDDVADAITRENIRSLLTANTIKIKPIVGASKGRKGARVGKKEVYVAKVRALRRRLKVVKDRKEITNKEFWELYKKIGGNTVRNIAHLRTLIEETQAKRKS